MIFLSNNNVNINPKKDKKSIEERDDFLANRLMALLVAVTALIVILLLLKKNNNIFEALFIINVLPFVRLGSGLIFIAAAVNFIIKRLRHADESMKFFGSPMLFGIALLLFGISIIFTYLLVIGTVICFIAALLIYFIYCFYQRDFFWFSIVTAAGTVLLYTSSLSTTTGLLKNIIKTAAKTSAVILPVLFIIAVLIFRRADGCVMLHKKKIRLMKSEYSYYPFIVAPAITLAGSVTALFFYGSMIYSMIILLAAYLVIAIIYTVKMI